MDTSGLEYLRARFYDNATGRFLRRDPLPVIQRYPYVGNNPVNVIDPYGLWGLGDVADAVQEVTEPVADFVAENALPALQQCAIWGLGGLVAGAGPAGAAAGCAAGATLVVVDALIGPSPITGCLAWAAAGYVGTMWNPIGAGVGCIAGAASYYTGESPEGQCGVWLLSGFATARVVSASAFTTIRAGVAGCLTGAVSVNRALAAEAGKE